MAILTTVHRYLGDPVEQARSGANLIRGGDEDLDQNQNRVSTKPLYLLR